VVIRIVHSDQVDVLREALERYIKRIRYHEKRWRAVAAAEEILEQLPGESAKSTKAE
jgi:hypothetical protein